MTYPLKLQMALTQVCIDIHNANNINDMDHIAELPQLFEKNGYTFPIWLMVWMQLLKDDPLMNGEEHFKKPKVKASEFNGMSGSGFMLKNSMELIKIDAAITAICSDPYAAKRSALFVIASVILSESIENNDLGYEWHCRTDETQSLTDRHNFAVFVEILQREIDFFQDSVKSIKSKMPPKAQLSPNNIRI